MIRFLGLRSKTKSRAEPAPIGGVIYMATDDESQIMTLDEVSKSLRSDQARSYLGGVLRIEPTREIGD